MVKTSTNGKQLLQESQYCFFFPPPPQGSSLPSGSKALLFSLTVSWIYELMKHYFLSVSAEFLYWSTFIFYIWVLLSTLSWLHWLLWLFPFFDLFFSCIFFFFASAVIQLYSKGIANGSWIFSILLLELAVDELGRL